MKTARFHSLAIIAMAATTLVAEDKPKAAADDVFLPMFNGKDLSGWVNVNCHPSTFFTKDEEVITTGKPTGYLRTPKQYENFILEMDWMHVNTKDVGNSGLFVWGDPLPAVGTGYTRGIEVQVLVNLEYRDKKTNAITATSQGDLFSIWGAHCTPDRPHPLGWERCLPNGNYAKGGGEWNHYRVTANDGVIKLEVNGKEVSGVSKCSPRKGYLALESEGAECHFKNMKIKELPSTNPKPEDVANVADGHVSLFNGIDLMGWKAENDSWKVAGEKLVAAKTEDLATEKKYKDGYLMFDWKIPASSTQTWNVEIGQEKKEMKAEKPGKWQRMQLDITPTRSGSSIVFKPITGLEIMNVFLLGQTRMIAITLPSSRGIGWVESSLARRAQRG